MENNNKFNKNLNENDEKNNNLYYQARFHPRYHALRYHRYATYPRYVYIYPQYPSYDNKKSCSYGHVSATSFFPAKPLGGYGDGGAIFTNDSKKADIYRSIRVHGQGIDKYDNIRVGLNSRLDTIQAAVLLNKLKIFDSELDLRNNVANYYSDKLYNSLIIPVVRNNYTSSWAQYSVLANDNKEREELMKYLNNSKIPAVIYYRKPFNELDIYKNESNDVYPVSKECSLRIFSIPMYPYLNRKNQDIVIDKIIKFYK